VLDCHNTSKDGNILIPATYISVYVLIFDRYLDLITAAADLVRKIGIFTCFFQVFFFPVFCHLSRHNSTPSQDVTAHSLGTAGLIEWELQHLVSLRDSAELELNFTL
jgi:hypothetical protein